MASRDDKEEIKKKRESFKDHVITEICNSNNVRRYKFANPETWCYGFFVTTADNLIVMNGDCYTLILEPGYGRDGLYFLINNIRRDWDYLLGKCPLRMTLTEYSYDQAMENLDYYLENEYITKEQYDSAYGLDEGELYSEGKYYEFCHEHYIDDPMSPRRLSSTTLLQIAGLQVFAEKFEQMCNTEEVASE